MCSPSVDTVRETGRQAIHRSTTVYMPCAAVQSLQQLLIVAAVSKYTMKLIVCRECGRYRCWHAASSIISAFRHDCVFAVHCVRSPASAVAGMPVQSDDKAIETLSF